MKPTHNVNMYQFAVHIHHVRGETQMQKSSPQQQVVIIMMKHVNRKLDPSVLDGG